VLVGLGHPSPRQTLSNYLSYSKHYFLHCGHEPLVTVAIGSVVVVLCWWLAAVLMFWRHGQFFFCGWDGMLFDDERADGRLQFSSLLFSVWTKSSILCLM
jgi:hypothetical protein